MLTEPEYFDEFFDAFAHSGSVLVTCRCGRVHIAQDEIAVLENEEIEELEKFEKERPEKVIRWNCDSVSWTYINGEEVVFDCPCGYDKIICHFIENHQEEIMRVIGKIVDNERSTLVNKEELLAKTTGE